MKLKKISRFGLFLATSATLISTFSIISCSSVFENQFDNLDSNGGFDTDSTLEIKITLKDNSNLLLAELKKSSNKTTNVEFKNWLAQAENKKIIIESLFDFSNNNIDNQITNQWNINLSVDLVIENQTAKFVFNLQEIGNFKLSQNRFLILLPTDLKPPQPPSPDIDNNFPNIGWNHDDDQFKSNAPASFSKPTTSGGKTKLKLANLASGTQPENGLASKPNLLKNKTPFDQVIKNVKRSFAVSFNDFKGNPYSGTAWILDYKIEQNNSYPLTWYFATNVHVMDSLKIEKETISEYQRWNGDKKSLTNNITFKTINPNHLNKTTDFGNSQQAKWKKEIIGIRNNNCEENIMISAYATVRTIFLGIDFMKTKPSDFSDDIQWKNLEEYADFGVFEMKFESAEQAKLLTQEYYEDKTNQFKMKKNSLLQEQNLTNKRFVVAGFPSNDGRVANLTTNNLAEYDNSIGSLEQAGQLLTRQKNYNSFKSFPGLHDAAISIPLLRGGGAIDMGKYVNWGLLVSINYSHIGPGSSGSMVTDVDNNVWGIHFAADDEASIDIVQALRSDGFSYYGYYGDYNLAAYDLVYGGGPMQKSSYFDLLKKIYWSNPDFKTNLFPNGLKKY